ncbi:DNA protecting protein DprA [Candidatus Uhrbacteria bacterium RIFCSPHIGHO2_12_FULL_60_25]|uniref:DNA protecting protein DprA n=1 Tax=Candidatus Uhrbacteria bacterium RIFCSPHIGHO2_12_FULL_60_25 TaxID=1802399 RepID=A0A1F7UM27_9BACT|nr:MAG: DNA protecting protein DprA [Candidatus Uhrbacteria bacterium RIFCSPHIGHO2_02_FULL_60_44]OGL79331.1 MAG: DNA protecting protein DprA [Candidatus Uhrbacteria bacterium RIFCSPHIGHO2_12_FULL_60_25]
MSYQNPSKTVKTSQVGSVGHWTPERLAALTVVSAWEIGSRTLRRIWEVGDVTAFLAQGPDEWSRFGLTSTQTAALSRSRTEDASRLAERLHDAGIRFLLPRDDEYPKYLGRTADPPGALFIRGTRLVDEVRVAVVGTRAMTDYGKRATDLIAGELGQSSITVVSGLALGVDAAAHEACIEAGGRAIAVLPSGVDDASIAPRTNLRLAHRILETGGALVSEQAPGTPTLPFQFLHRNRLISGLSDATVIVEADHDSGSLVTARLALEEGREVLAVPGPIFSPASRGTNDLIRNGARPCTSAADVLDALGYSNPERAKQISEARALVPVSGDEQKVLDVLTEPFGMDDISRRTGMSVSSVGAVVSMLELKGRIISVGPRTFVKKI